MRLDYYRPILINIFETQRHPEKFETINFNWLNENNTRYGHGTFTARVFFQI